MTIPRLPINRLLPPAIAGLLVLAGCVVSESSDSARKTAADSAALAAAAAAPDTSDISVPAYDSVSADTIGLGSQMAEYSPPAAAADTARIVIPTGGASRPASFPARIPARGPLALQLQVLLDRASFSPGIIDGMWGPNAAKALAWFRIANGFDSAASATSSDTTARRARTPASTSRATIDKATYDKLVGQSDMASLVTSYRVTPEDVKGPFVEIPNSVYDQAKLACLCYSSLPELLAERFHTSEKVLKQLNPGLDLKTMTAGISIQVPNASSSAASASSSATATGAIAKLVISRTGYWTHAVDSSGNVIQHYPSTLGAGYDPSPTGEFHITGIAYNPPFHYQPALMAEVPNTKPTARLAPGPNSPVGVVWLALSKPHYGIHGTSAPQTIGYANSHGCVRLTNWDVEKLAALVRAGTPVHFQ